MLFRSLARDMDDSEPGIAEDDNNDNDNDNDEDSSSVGSSSNPKAYMCTIDGCRKSYDKASSLSYVLDNSSHGLNCGEPTSTRSHMSQSKTHASGTFPCTIDGCTMVCDTPKSLWQVPNT